jgi:hypothetical protein
MTSAAATLIGSVIGATFGMFTRGLVVGAGAAVGVMLVLEVWR